MRFGDLIHLPLAALWQQKLRTFLTTLGVVFGSFVLACSLSIGQGVQQTMERLSHRNDLLRRISVNPGGRFGSRPDVDLSDIEIPVPGEMSDEVRDRIRSTLKRRAVRQGADFSEKKITQEVAADFRNLEHVESVVPIIGMQCDAYLGASHHMSMISSAQVENSDCKARLIAGRIFNSATERSVLVSELLLYQLGIIDEAARRAIVGQPLRLVFAFYRQGHDLHVYLSKPDDSSPTTSEQTVLDKIRQQLPGMISKFDLTEAERLLLKEGTQGAALPKIEPIEFEFPIAGVIRVLTDEEEQDHLAPDRFRSDIVLPTDTAVDVNFSVPLFAKQGISHAYVSVDHERNVKEVQTKINATGLHTHAPLEFIERERLMYLIIFGAMTFVAAVALLVAALGIANTMLMSVLERTREIGIMKAVGAGNGTLQFLFLLEGALIGILGGSCGLILAWMASFPGDAWIRSMISREIQINLKESIFVFPYWLTIVVVGFTSLVTTLAAVLPAQRAARIDPVRALRHE